MSELVSKTVILGFVLEPTGGLGPLNLLWYLRRGILPEKLGRKIDWLGSLT